MLKIRSNVAFLSLVLFSMTPYTKAADRNELERLAADLGNQHMIVSTTTAEIGPTRSDLTFDSCDVHWQDHGGNSDSYVNCHVRYEDQFFHGKGDVTINESDGRVSLHLRWEDGSTYSIHLDLDLARGAGLVPWRGAGEFTARYRFQVWHGKWWQVDLHGRASL
jgi:hypothetical protein